MKTTHRILATTIAALLAGASADAVTYQWDGGAGTGDWQTAANWNPDALNTSFKTAGVNRLSVNGATTLIYSAAEGTTVYGNSAAASRGLVIGSGALGSGSMIISGGSFSTLGSTAPDVIGNATVAATSLLTIAGGSFIGSDAGFVVNFGSANQTSSLNVSSGSATFATLTLSQSGSGSATANLDGGILAANLINRTGAAAGTFNFNGGTLQARQSTPTVLQGLTAANVKAGGATVDTNGFDITIGQALLDGGGRGGLVKNSAGTLTLSGANTFTGATTINAGTLQVGACRIPL